MAADALKGCAVSLEDILALKERRAAEIMRLSGLYNSPVICFKLNIAGGVKRFPLAAHFFTAGAKRILNALAESGFGCLHTAVRRESAGDTAFFVCGGDAKDLKRVMCGIEEQTEAGRLYDIDVYTKECVPYARREMARGPRSCLICGGEAHACARSRRHPVEEVLKKTLKLMRGALAEDIEAAACDAMMKELYTTPKPGLVDRNNNGAHADMDCALFEKSAAAIAPYFKQMALYAFDFDGTPEDMLGGLKRIGLCAQEAMLAATGGVNTHKGLIFSFGLVCAAAACLYAENETAVEADIFRLAARIASPALKEMGAKADTHGQKAFLSHQVKGARGQAASGFPCAREVGLPALKRALAEGKSENDAGVYALMHLMAHLDDTNIIARSDAGMLIRIRARAKALTEKKLPTEAFLREVARMDAWFIQKNISAGGCADMLALCWLVYMLAN